MSDGGAAAAPSPALAAEGSKKKMLNINVGVLGHVDSGKTSLGTSVATSPQLSSEKKGLHPLAKYYYLCAHRHVA